MWQSPWELALLVSQKETLTAWLPLVQVAFPRMTTSILKSDQVILSLAEATMDGTLSPHCTHCKSLWWHPSLQQKAPEITFLSPTLCFSKGLSFALFSSSHTLVAQWNRPGAFKISALFTYPEQWTESIVSAMDWIHTFTVKCSPGFLLFLDAFPFQVALWASCHFAPKRWGRMMYSEATSHVTLGKLLSLCPECFHL